MRSEEYVRFSCVPKSLEHLALVAGNWRKACWNGLS